MSRWMATSEVLEQRDGSLAMHSEFGITVL